RRRHTRSDRDWSSDVCSSDLADEGKGLDFVLEVLHRGDRKKDLVENVERYARLRIPEYFIYDRARQQINGYRLAGAKRYQRIVRSEERRVGKEGRPRWSPDQE